MEIVLTKFMYLRDLYTTTILLLQRINSCYTGAFTKGPSTTFSDMYFAGHVLYTNLDEDRGNVMSM